LAYRLRGETEESQIVANSGTSFFESLAARLGLHVDTMPDTARVDTCELTREAHALALRWGR
jgi:hypothetical protein